MFNLYKLISNLTLVLSVFLISSFHVNAQSEYPSKPIKLIVPYATGGVSDAIGRVLAQSLGSILKQSVVVENRGGAGGTIGAAAVAKAPPGWIHYLINKSAYDCCCTSIIKGSDLP